ncbi:hypothetical protein F5880DRAFT_1510650 [Lentinula raphanica]|nr:hypothetical protein F5880DRAFT_1510650 [Lentinula raphanica]
MAKSSQGVHPKLGKILKRMFNEVDKVGGAAVGEKRRRTMPRTFKDSNEIVLNGLSRNLRDSDEVEGSDERELSEAARWSVVVANIPFPRNIFSVIEIQRARIHQLRFVPQSILKILPTHQ